MLETAFRVRPPHERYHHRGPAWRSVERESTDMEKQDIESLEIIRRKVGLRNHALSHRNSVCRTSKQGSLICYGLEHFGRW